MRSGSRRGRPAGLVNRPPYAEARPDVVATLRAAIPWQRLRNPEASGNWQEPASVLPTDFRYMRFRHRTEVDRDLCGGCVRLHRDFTAIRGQGVQSSCYWAIMFAGQCGIGCSRFAAETLLEPYLFAAKAQPHGLPGGESTRRRHREALSRQYGGRRGQSPLIVYLTDGRGNIALDGSPDRERAAE
ncbi:MAG: hypothetical protein R3D34_09135 [Nitratireductor sp.]